MTMMMMIITTQKSGYLDETMMRMIITTQKSGYYGETMMMRVIKTQIPFVAGGTSDSMGVSDPAVEERHPLTTNL